MVRSEDPGAVLEVQVIVAQGEVYEERPLPAAWAIVKPSSTQLDACVSLDAFVFSSIALKAGQTLQVKIYAYCHLSEDGALSHVLLAVPERETPTVDALRAYESKMGRFLHRHFEILGWGNALAVKNLLALRYNISI